MTARKPPEEHKPDGRPTKYKSEYVELVHNLTLLGMLDAELAKALDIGETTLNVWKRKYPEFRQAIKSGRAEADGKIIASLHKRGLGYDIQEDRVTPRGDVVKCKVHIPGDVRAMQFILKNRQKTYWRDKHEVHNTGDVTLNFDPRERGLIEE